MLEDTLVGGLVVLVLLGMSPRELETASGNEGGSRAKLNERRSS